MKCTPMVIIEIRSGDIPTPILRLAIPVDRWRDCDWLTKMVNQLVVAPHKALWGNVSVKLRWNEYTRRLDIILVDADSSESIWGYIADNLDNSITIVR